ncbi:MAG TPA: phosphoribosylanthranilate isomerase [Terracidiphilus sp.]|nr:phosphoribosylanthranilate isomerase [Terracidiphilus sp.]
MSLWIKICGNTSLEDATLAAEAGADALGFVFAPSPRHVTREQVAKIIPHLPPAIEKIGVFVDATFEEIEAIVSACNLTGVQLQFEANPDTRSQLRDKFGPNLRILQTLHFNPAIAEQAAALAPDRNIDALLVDSRTATAVGGTGIALDWTGAASTLFGTPGTHHKLVAAGGLTPENVSEAIAVLNPWGVDVVSGVESVPGCKNPEKVRAFITQARAATAKNKRAT